MKNWSVDVNKEKISVKSHLWEKKLNYGGGLLVFLVLSVISVIIPAISGRIIDGLNTATIQLNEVLIFCLQILGLAALTVLCNFLARVFILKSANEYGRDGRNKVFDHLLKLSMSYYNKNSVGDIMALSTNDLRIVRMSIMRTVMILGRALFIVILSFIAMANIASVRLALIVMIPMPVLAFVTLKFGPIMRVKYRKVQGAFADLTTKTQENVSGIRVIKAFAQEKEEIKNFEKINEENFQINKDLIRTTSIFHPLLHVLSAISFLLLFSVGGSMVIKSTITTGDYVASVQYIGNMLRPFAMLGMMVEMVQSAKASLARLNTFFGEKYDIEDEVDEKEFIKEYGIDKMAGKITFKNLSFRYDMEQDYILKDINLNIDAGQTVGIIGKIGCGKSTLAQIIMNLYHVDNGMILIDDIDIDKIPVKILRNSIGYIPQTNFLFSDSIIDNIGFSPRELDEEDAKKCAKVSQIYDSIMEIETGFDTKLGEKGVNLSGGQKQRISIARALYRNPSILLVDDALSAVDTQTEAQILQGLKPFSENITTLIIAHRVSTIEHSDIIIVMDNGSIVEQGNHEELMAIGGEYYDIYQRQQMDNTADGGDV